MNEMNKKIEPGYHYISPEVGEVEGAVGPAEAGKLAPIKDELMPIGPTAPAAKPGRIPVLDAPELPHPTEKALQTMARKGKVVEQEKKIVNEKQALLQGGAKKLDEGEGGELGIKTSDDDEKEELGIKKLGDGGREEPGVKKSDGEGDDKKFLTHYPNYTGVYFAILFEIQKMASVARHKESEIKQQLEAAMFSIGMENADLQKELKDLAASKEFTQAIGSFINAGAALYQASSLAKARGEADNRAKIGPDGQPTDLQKKITAHEERITKLEEKANAKVFAGGSAEEIANAKKAWIEKKITPEKTKLEDAKGKMRQEIREEMNFMMQSAQAQAKAIEESTRGSVGVVSALFTLEEGSKEKTKSRNDALIQYLTN